MSENRVTEPEIKFFNKIKTSCNIIFDVGACDDSSFLQEKKEVHYFEPFAEYFDRLKNKQNNNTKAVFNQFGLGQKNESLHYYKEYMAFFNRGYLPHIQPAFELPLKRADEYVKEHKVEQIDFLKLDVEGFEIDVLLGFNDFLQNIKYIQFEYGGTYQDKGVKLNDVITLLNKYNFTGYSELVPTGLAVIEDFTDHYNYMNVVCYNKDHTSKFW